MAFGGVRDGALEAGTMSPVLTSDPVQVRCDDGSRFGTVAPCNGKREFAEHMEAPVSDPSGGFDFQVAWTPPGNELGDIRVYAPAVAADRDGTAAGERVYKVVKTMPALAGRPPTQRPTPPTRTTAPSCEQTPSSTTMITM